jgi:hypothetical protein
MVFAGNRANRNPMTTKSTQKSSTTLLILLLVIITFPIWIGFFAAAAGIVGGVFGTHCVRGHLRNDWGHAGCHREPDHLANQNDFWSWKLVSPHQRLYGCCHLDRDCADLEIEKRQA